MKVGRPIATVPARYCEKVEELPGGDFLLHSGNSTTCLEAEGQVRWHLGDTRDTIVGPDGRVLTIQNGALTELDPENGEQLWKMEPQPKMRFLQPALSPDGKIYVGSDKNLVFQVDPSKPEPVAEFRLGRNWLPRWLESNIYLAPATDNQGNVLLEGTFSVTCRTPEGKAKWREKFGEAINDPQFIRGQWFLSDNKGELHALGPEGGVRWRTGQRTPNGGNMHVDCLTEGPPGIVYFHPTGHPLVALDEFTGREIFRFGEHRSGHTHYRAELGDDGLLYVSTNSWRRKDIGAEINRLHVLNAETGEPVQEAIEVAEVSSRFGSMET